MAAGLRGQNVAVERQQLEPAREAVHEGGGAREGVRPLALGAALELQGLAGHILDDARGEMLVLIGLEHPDGREASFRRVPERTGHAEVRAVAVGDLPREHVATSGDLLDDHRRPVSAEGWGRARLQHGRVRDPAVSKVQADAEARGARDGLEPLMVSPEVDIAREESVVFAVDRTEGGEDALKEFSGRERPIEDPT